MRRPHTSPQQRESFIRQFEQSNLTQEEFARRNNLNTGTFRKWLYDFRKESNFRFVEVQTQVQTVSTIEASSMTLLHLPGGMFLEFDSLPPADYICKIVHSMEKAC